MSLALTSLLKKETSHSRLERQVSTYLALPSLCLLLPLLPTLLLTRRSRRLERQVSTPLVTYHSLRST